MKNLAVLILFFCLCIFLGCLGMGGSSGPGASNGVVSPSDSSVVLAGKIFFADRQLYGNIPVAAVNAAKQRVATTKTDSSGNFTFSDLAPGIYDLVAITGDSEVTFARSVQIDGLSTKQLEEKSLLGIQYATVKNINDQSFGIEFKSNRLCRASIEYGPVGGFQQIKTIGQAGALFHETDIEGLNHLTDYEISLYLTGDDGQEFVYRGLFAATTAETGPTDLTIAINDGAYETRSQNVTLNLSAENAISMRIGETFDLAEATWVNYSSSYNYGFTDTNPGSKRVYVQFKDKTGILSPVQTDSILFNQSGYLGMWINDGSAITSDLSVSLKIIYPGAAQMQIANSADFLQSFWETYNEQKRWQLSSGDGLKTIYARFKGGNADESATFKASIVLDTTPPQVEIKINGGALKTASTSVAISFAYSSQPSSMKISNSEITSSDSWQNFSNSLNWTLTSGDGSKTVYGLFKDQAGNEYGPVSTIIELDTTPPAGNDIKILESELSESPETTNTLTASLPVYLHFSITDTDTENAFYAITEKDAEEPENFFTVTQPFSPIALDQEKLPVGEHKVWVKFSDAANNLSFIKTASIKVEGPNILVTPKLSRLFSGQTQQFQTAIENISAAELGDIRWKIVGSGTIDATGLFTAPAPILRSSATTIRAEGTSRSDIFGQATVNLATSVEVLFYDGNTFKYGPVSRNLQPGQTTQIAVKVIHSQSSFNVSQPQSGSVSVTSPMLNEIENETIATITYNAPAIPPTENSQLDLTVTAIDNSSAVGILTIYISTGQSITITSDTDNVQKNESMSINANLSAEANPPASRIDWQLVPADSGSFSDDSIVTSISTTDPHRITFYPGTTDNKKTVEISARTPDAENQKELTLHPPVSFSISPLKATAMPIVEEINLEVKDSSFSNIIGETGKTVKWYFKNANSAEFRIADGNSYTDRGKLTVSTENPNLAVYERPTEQPSVTDATASDTIIVKASLEADEDVFATASISILERVRVKIFDSVEKETEISETRTVAEVGKIQFFSQVTPSGIGLSSVDWTVNGGAGDSQYGTIDANGLYIAPETVLVDFVTVRATSKYDKSAFAEVKVNLDEFWISKRQNMSDTTTGELMPITAIAVDPTTQVGENFKVYAGTYGYGVWFAEFSDEPGDNSGGDWQKIPDLAVDGKSSEPQYAINDIAINSKGKVYVSTLEGIYFVNSSDSAKRLKVFPDTDLTTRNYFKLEFDSTHPERIFASTPDGVYLITLEESQNDIIVDEKLVLDVKTPYRQWETRVKEDVVVEAYSNVTTVNPINADLKPILFDEANGRLYGAGEKGRFLFYSDADQKNIENIIASTFSSSAPSTDADTASIYTLEIKHSPFSQPVFDPDNIVSDFSLDLINRNTIWAATVAGVFRSVNYGATWELKPLGAAGSAVNTKAILVDQTNTINVLAGSEDGLYRSTDAGATWKRIFSGLGNHKTITCLTQASGKAGERRKVWVGTAGGVFMGRASLDLE